MEEIISQSKKETAGIICVHLIAKLIPKCKIGPAWWNIICWKEGVKSVCLSWDESRVAMSW